MKFNFLDLPERANKKRNSGITHVLDKGLGLNAAEDLLSTASKYIDIIKLGWGTGYITTNIKEKIRLYQKADIPVCFGGTFFELAIMEGKYNDYIKTLSSLNISHIEISNGSIDLDISEKLRYIKELKKNFVVLSEVGSKDPENIYSPEKWIYFIQSELNAGAWKVITEARESGTVGIYKNTGEIRSDIIDEITNNIDPNNLIFEAPKKQQQLFLIKKYGNNVNLGNIPTNDVISLETLRLGLRGDTINIFHKDIRVNG